MLYYLPPKSATGMVCHKPEFIMRVTTSQRTVDAEKLDIV